MGWFLPHTTNISKIIFYYPRTKFVLMTCNLAKVGPFGPTLERKPWILAKQVYKPGLCNQFIIKNINN